MRTLPGLCGVHLGVYLGLAGTRGDAAVNDAHALLSLNATRADVSADHFNHLSCSPVLPDDVTATWAHQVEWVMDYYMTSFIGEGYNWLFHELQEKSDGKRRCLDITKREGTLAAKEEELKEAILAKKEASTIKNLRLDLEHLQGLQAEARAYKSNTNPPKDGCNRKTGDTKRRNRDAKMEIQKACTFGKARNFKCFEKEHEWLQWASGAVVSLVVETDLREQRSAKSPTSGAFTREIGTRYLKAVNPHNIKYAMKASHLEVNNLFKEVMATFTDAVDKVSQVSDHMDWLRDPKFLLHQNNQLEYLYKGTVAEQNAPVQLQWCKPSFEGDTW